MRDLVMLIIGAVLGMIVQGVLVIIAIVQGKLKICPVEENPTECKNQKGTP